MEDHPCMHGQARMISWKSAICGKGEPVPQWCHRWSACAIDGRPSMATKLPQMIQSDRSGGRIDGMRVNNLIAVICPAKISLEYYY